MFFKQVKQRGDNFSYIIADDATKEAAIVDPSFNTDTIAQVLKDHGLKLKYIIDTHHHTDHIAGNQDLKARYGAMIIAHASSKIRKDIGVVDGESIKVGRVEVKVIHTPGHTSDSICLLVDNKLLTGDTLFVGECGRTDLPDGNTRDMYNSLFNKLMKLDDNVEVYPGHDYGSTPTSTIGLEKKNNYTLEKRSLEKFIEFMKEP
jgi:hydroxyacylglutathione hydrolase